MTGKVRPHEQDTDGAGEAGVQTVNDGLQLIWQAWYVEEVLLAPVSTYSEQ